MNEEISKHIQIRETLGLEGIEEEIISLIKKNKEEFKVFMSGASSAASVGGTSDHSALSNLDYASAGHTGFLEDTADIIKDTHIDWGTGANQVSAVDMPIADVGGYYVGTEVETALQEIGAGLPSGPYLLLDQTTPQTIIGGIPLLTGLTPTTDYQIATKKYVDDNAGAAPSAGTVTYTDNKITQIVKGAITYVITYTGNKVNTITDGTTTWTMTYSGNKLSGWTI